MAAAGGVAVVSALAVAGLTWAKWLPYSHKLSALVRSHRWKGTSMLAVAHGHAAAPSLRGAWAFTVAYGRAVWPALVVALVVAAALEALVPHERLVGLLSRRTAFGGTVVAGALALPCMMCTCCSAPLAVTLRRRGVPLRSVLGYWLGNPVLNPAVLVFLALVGPWQWVVTRLGVGAALVFGGPALIARLSGHSRDDPLHAGPSELPPSGPMGAGRRFASTLGRLLVVLGPEYFVVVLLVGGLRGWLFPFGAWGAHWGLLALVVAAVVGTLLVVPTAGEIPVLQGLAALGVTAGPLGALLVALPAVSLPSMVMTGRALSLRVVATTAAVVGAAAVLAGAVLWVLT